MIFYSSPAGTCLIALINSCQNVNRIFYEESTCAGHGAPPGYAAEISSEPPQRWRNLVQMPSLQLLWHPPVPAKPPGIDPAVTV